MCMICKMNNRLECNVELLQIFVERKFIARDVRFPETIEILTAVVVVAIGISNLTVEIKAAVHPKLPTHTCDVKLVVFWDTVLDSTMH